MLNVLTKVETNIVFYAILLYPANTFNLRQSYACVFENTPLQTCQRIIDFLVHVNNIISEAAAAVAATLLFN